LARLLFISKNVFFSTALEDKSLHHRARHLTATLQYLGSSLASGLGTNFRPRSWAFSLVIVLFWVIGFASTAAADTARAIGGSTPQSATVSTAFGNPLAVTVQDALFHPIQGAQVVFTAPADGPTGNFGGATNTLTNASGIASVPFFAGTVAGTYNVTATVQVGPVTLTVQFALTNTAAPITDSARLRSLQVLVTPMVAQTSGQAISNAVDSAISEGFNGGGTFIGSNGGGIRMNFAADPEEQGPELAARAGELFTGADQSLAQDSRGFSSRPPSSRIDDSFSSLAYAGPPKAPPVNVAELREWLGWVDVRGATLDHAGGTSAISGTNVLNGKQINALAGLTHKFTSNFLMGVLGGYETFDYRSEALQGRLKGDGLTVGSYLGWMILPNIRFDTSIAYSVIGYSGTAGLAGGSFTGNRWLATTGLTGTYVANGFEIEPSARVYALRERENAYTDTLGILQAARDFSTGRASSGLKLSYPVGWSTAALFAPYFGVYGDFYFNKESAGILAPGAIPFAVLDGWSARAVGGLTATLANGAQIAIGGERGGIGGNFALWTYRARASVPFGAL
jgi:hypothetical protein